jgi:hypothetical protein
VVRLAGGGTPPGAGRRRAVGALLVALFVLHQDAWLWRDPRLLLGLPIGLAYHVAYCVAVSAVLVLAVRWGWPREVPADEAAGGGEGPA